MLHVLLHMDRHDRPVTSEEIAGMLGTNAVVVRRTMAGLRDQGYVRSEKGHGGGWTLACELKAITLLGVYRAVGEPRIFAVGPSEDNPQCLVEQAVNDTVSDAMRQAESLLIARFADVNLADLARDFDDRMKSAGRTAAAGLCETIREP